MHRIVLLLLLVPIAGAQVDLTFTPPGQWEGDASVEASWLVVVLEEGPAGEVHIEAPTATALNHTVRYAAARAAGTATVGGGLPSTPAKDEGEGRLDATARFSSPGRSSLVLVADDIQIEALDASGRLRILGPDGRPYEAVQEHGRSTNLIRASHDWSNHALIEGAKGSLSIHATGVRSVEWMNASVTCPAGWCPSGGGLLGEDHAAGNSRILAYSISFVEVGTEGGTLGGTVAAAAWGAGGTSLDAGLQGWLRLPLIATDCRCHTDLEGKTLQANGTIRLTDLRMMNHRLAASAGGDVGWLRADEIQVAPSLLGWGKASTAASLAVVALPFVLLFLLRHANENRRRIQSLIAGKPGVTFRGIMRTLNLANSTVSHHTRWLLKRGEIVRMEQGKTHHFFENHGRYGEVERVRLLTLKDAPSRLLAATMVALGTIRERDALVIVQRNLGWHRSTTQRRLQAIVSAGIIETWKSQGRWYRPSDNHVSFQALDSVFTKAAIHDGEAMMT